MPTHAVQMFITVTMLIFIMSIMFCFFYILFYFVYFSIALFIRDMGIFSILDHWVISLGLLLLRATVQQMVIFIVDFSVDYFLDNRLVRFMVK